MKSLGRKIGFYCALLLLLQGSKVVGQDTTAIDMAHQKVSHRWLFSTNPNAIQYASAPKISVAEATYQKSNGGFVNYHQSDNSYQYGAQTESYYRINPLVAFYGKVEFTNFQGKNMAGSAFIDPYQTSFDIQELSDATRGTKKREQYLLTGGLSYQIAPKWQIGGKLHFESSNFTKIKDLRHTNKLLHMNLNVGSIYTLNESIKFGLNYAYDRRIESLRFDIYGNTDTQYLSLISFGNFWGRTELFTESGYTSANSPLTNFQHNIDAQVDVQLTPRLQWLTEVGYQLANGYFGEKGTNSITYLEHTQDGISANTTFSLQKTRSLQHIRLAFQHNTLDNFENVFRRETSSGGVSSIVYYGQNKVTNRTLTSLEARYNALLRGKSNAPAWLLETKLGFYQRAITSTNYPYFRKSDLTYTKVTASADKYLSTLQKQWTIGASIGYQSGQGTPYLDSSHTSSSQMKPTSRDTYLAQEFAYLTSAQIQISPKIQYQFPLTDLAKGYVRTQYFLTKALDAVLLPTFFQQFQLTLGVQF